jgi:uncharacterized protein (DUF4415 family)
MNASKPGSGPDSGQTMSPDEIGWDPDDAPELDDGWFAEAELRRNGTLIRRESVARETEQVALPADVVARFRARGAGWQGRIEAALKEWLAEHPERV